MLKTLTPNLSDFTEIYTHATRDAEALFRGTKSLVCGYTITLISASWLTGVRKEKLENCTLIFFTVSAKKWQMPLPITFYDL